MMVIIKEQKKRKLFAFSLLVILFNAIFFKYLIFKRLFFVPIFLRKYHLIFQLFESLFKQNYMHFCHINMNIVVVTYATLNAHLYSWLPSIN